ncbi:DUF4352 domain-containing protein [Alkalihalobacterium elongatum]|uniref:DUF4352 domain-containing protein n=1 Tax=Alkalihalobacterium elongatum TaxID=2675466 RepID=UPI001C1F4DB4|nr:DUF4352 domain-containing protein [Alkalihalobacterium elongatum]
MSKSVLAILVVLMLVLTACGEETSTPVDREGSEEDLITNEEEKTESEDLLSEQEFVQMLSSPAQFKGSKVEYIGRVFVVEKDSDATYLQIWADPEKNDHNTIVHIPDPNLVVTDEDYIKILGEVIDEFKGENAFGAQLTAPLIKANNYEVVDYITAVSPTLHEVIVNQEQSQSGYSIEVEKVEFGEKDTRIYVSIKNESNDSISFWSHSAKVVQGGKQYDTEYNWEANYSELQSDIRPGVVSEGILSFARLDFESNKELTLYLDGASDNWDISIEEFQFHIEW